MNNSFWIEHALSYYLAHNLLSILSLMLFFFLLIFSPFLFFIAFYLILFYFISFYMKVIKLFISCYILFTLYRVLTHSSSSVLGMFFIARLHIEQQRCKSRCMLVVVIFIFFVFSRWSWLVSGSQGESFLCMTLLLSFFVRSEGWNWNKLKRRFDI